MSDVSHTHNAVSALDAHHEAKDMIAKLNLNANQKKGSHRKETPPIRRGKTAAALAELHGFIPIGRASQEQI